ncbi:DUF6668 family protein [Corynebacterium sp. S7]
MMSISTTYQKQRGQPENDVEVAPRLKVDAQTRHALTVAEEPIFTGEGYSPVAWAVGAHGGAGATTLARTLAPVGDAGAAWPTKDEYPLCVVVCRSTRMGLDAAQSAVLQAKSGHAGECEVLGVVIVADAPGRTPKSLVRRETVLEELTHVWHVSYLPGIRENDVSDLAVWVPRSDSEDEGQRRSRKKNLPVTEEVPQTIAQLGANIFEAAYAAHSLKDKDK